MSTKRMGGLVIRQGKRFRLLERRRRFYVECLAENCVPRILRVGRDAAMELSCGEIISNREFDSACLFSGCGVFRKEEP